MGLNAETVAAIKQEAGHNFGVQAAVWQFRSQQDKQRGFTLVELITIMIIIGILAVAALPRLSGNDAFLSRGAADQVVSALRFGQKSAVAKHSDVSVAITLSANPKCPVAAGASVSCSISNSLTTTNVPLTVTFNALGRPAAGAASVMVGTTTINIEAETGYVH